MLLISTVRAGKEPQGHASKRLMQAAQGLSKCYSVMSHLPSSGLTPSADPERYPPPGAFTV